MISVDAIPENMLDEVRFFVCFFSFSIYFMNYKAMKQWYFGYCYLYAT